jgi:hypothetical protein
MPKEKNEANASLKGGALQKTRDEQLAAMRGLGGTTESSSLRLPLLKLEHTVSAGGEANPDKGKFTLAVKDGLGNWKKSVLGEEIIIHFLLQRYVLSLIDNDTSYSSPEFDNPNEIVRLWRSIGQGDSRKTDLYAEDIPGELSKKFLVTKNNRTASSLKLLVVLYGELEHDGKIELVKWSTNVSGTVGYRKYSRKTTPFAVLTKVGREEALSGSNKYYQPKFTVVQEMPDFEEVIKKQESLITSLKVGIEGAGNVAETLGIATDEENNESFK